MSTTCASAEAPTNPRLGRWGAVALTCACLAQTHAGAATDATAILDPAQSVTLERRGKAEPFTRAADAIAAARDGDVVRLGPGTHRGPLLLEHAGVTLRGEPGARIDANDATWVPRWEKAPRFGRLAFASPIPFVPGAVSVDDRVMIDARESRGGLVLHDGGLGDDSRLPVQGVYTYVEKEKLLVVSFADGGDPSSRRVAASPRSTAAVMVRGADRCRVEGLIVTGGETGVALVGTSGSVVERCLVYAVDTGVLVGKGSSSCRVLACDLTMNPDSLSLDCDRMSVGKAVWHAHKRVGTYDKRAVLVSLAGNDNEVAWNFMYNNWDGVENDNGVGKDDVAAHYTNKVYKGIVEYNRGLRVHHNRLDLAHDDALEPGDVLADHHWFANVVTRARVAVRFKTISLGPFYFYDNVILDSGTGLRLYKSMPACANVYVFNNVVRNKAGLVYLSMNEVCWNDPWLASTLPRGTPGFRIFNNVFVCSTPFSNQEGDVPPNFVSDYNLYTSAATDSFPPKGSDAHSLFGAAPVFTDVTNGNWRLATGSPGRGAGCVLATFCPAPPASLAERAQVPSTDMGLPQAVPARDTPQGPVSGLWELAAKAINLGERDPAQFSLDPDGKVPLRPLWGRGVPGTGPLEPQSVAPSNPQPAVKVPATPDDAPTAELRNGRFERLSASGAPAGWQVYGTPELAIEREGSAPRLKVHVAKANREQGSLAQTIVGLPAGTRYALTGTVQASKAGLAYLQVKVKEGKQEVARANSERGGVEPKELRVVFETREGATVSVQCRFSQETAGESVWFSDLKLTPVPE